MNKKLTNVSSSFNDNKLSLNVKKTSILFLQIIKKRFIPLRLLNLNNANELTVERESLIKLSEVRIDENLTRRDLIHID